MNKQIAGIAAATGLGTAISFFSGGMNVPALLKGVGSSLPASVVATTVVGSGKKEDGEGGDVSADLQAKLAQFDSQLQSSEAQLAQVQSQEQEAIAGIEALGTQKQTLETEVTDLQAQIQTLEAEKAENLQAKETFERELVDLQAQVQTLEAQSSELPPVSPEEQSELQAQMSARQAELEGLSTQVAEQRGLQESLAQEVAALEQQKQELEGAIADMPAPSETTADPEQAARQAELEAALPELEAQKQQLEASLGELTQQKEAIEASLPQLEEQKSTLEASLPQLQEQKATLEASLPDLEQQKQSLEATLGSLRDEERSLGEAIATHKADNPSLSALMDNAAEMPAAAGAGLAGAAAGLAAGVAGMGGLFGGEAEAPEAPEMPTEPDVDASLTSLLGETEVPTPPVEAVTANGMPDLSGLFGSDGDSLEMPSVPEMPDVPEMPSVPEMPDAQEAIGAVAAAAEDNSLSALLGDAESAVSDTAASAPELSDLFGGESVDLGAMTENMPEGIADVFDPASASDSAAAGFAGLLDGVGDMPAAVEKATDALPDEMKELTNMFGGGEDESDVPTDLGALFSTSESKE